MITDKRQVIGKPLSPNLYVVMDSRAQYDEDAAIVLECVGEHRPSKRYLQAAWRNQGAVLVRWYDPGPMTITKGPGDGDIGYRKSEIIGVIP
jgi:hypothetical protein